ncbi:hypothetical protein SAMN04487949_1766 [Halogranum gelatinilyticum]|uniref:DUF8125 domain-containing protein n=1 Tax=Halogranum gelatinilyticum TaxID=660521 RepID=A0A1G9TH34_9EURY|nr:hypothetical protein [Halogranum gelatinilyticum]SDM46868.1 hypothetical protein SAMN04487949_1766 [Halogranum gelatinilyticum]
MSDADLAPREQADNPTEDPSTSWYELAVWCVDNRMWILGGVGLLVFVAGSLLGVEIPRNLRIVGISVAVLTPLVGKPFGRRVRSMLFDPSLITIVDVDAADPSGAGVFQVSSQEFRDLEVVEGALDWIHPTLVFARDVNEDEGTLRGTWRGTLTDRELLASLHAVQRCRGQLEKDAQEGFALKSQAWSVVREAARSATMSVVSTFKRGSLPDEGEGLDDAIESALEDFGIERDLDDTDENNPLGNLSEMVEKMEENGSPSTNSADAAQPEAPADD